MEQVGLKNTVKLKAIEELPLFRDLPENLVKYLRENLKAKSLKAKESLFFSGR